VLFLLYLKEKKKAGYFQRALDTKKPAPRPRTVTRKITLSQKAARDRFSTRSPTSSARLTSGLRITRVNKSYARSWGSHPKLLGSIAGRYSGKGRNPRDKLPGAEDICHAQARAQAPDHDDGPGTAQAL